MPIRKNKKENDYDNLAQYKTTGPAYPRSSMPTTNSLRAASAPVGGVAPLVQHFLKSLPDKRYKTLVLTHSSVTGTDLLRLLCMELGQTARGHQGLSGDTTDEKAGGPAPQVVGLENYRWQSHCHGLFELPIAA